MLKYLRIAKLDIVQTITGALILVRFYIDHINDDSHFFLFDEGMNVSKLPSMNIIGSIMHSYSNMIANIDYALSYFTYY